MTTPENSIAGSPNSLAWPTLTMSRTLWYAIVVCLIAAPVRAEPMEFEGTVSLNLLASRKTEVQVAGTGVADVNKGGPDIALNTLDLAGGISGSVAVPVTDPEVTATIASIRWDAALGTGSVVGTPSQFQRSLIVVDEYLMRHEPVAKRSECLARCSDAEAA